MSMSRASHRRTASGWRTAGPRRRSGMKAYLRALKGVAKRLDDKRPPGNIAQALVEMFDDPKDLSELIFGIEMDAKAKFGHKLLRIR